MPKSSKGIAKFWQELKRRKVIHVIVVYASAAFIIIELVNNITEPLKLPEWTPTLVIILLLVGFPLAIIFSWIFDVTPEGIERTKSMDELRTEEASDRQLSRERKIYWGRVINWGITGLLIVVVATYILIHYDIFAEETIPYRFSLDVPEGYKFGSSEDGSLISISPDGTKLVYVAEREGVSQLFMRSMDAFEATPIPGTEGASSPFFSPDGKWVFFYSGGNLNKVSLLGGFPQLICEANYGHGGTWLNDSTIIFNSSNTRSLYKVSPAGGVPEQITSALKYSTEGVESAHLWPHALPGGKEILYTITHGNDEKSIVLFSLETGEKREILQPGSDARFIQPGYLIYTWKGDLFAVSFNLRKKIVNSEPVLICKGVKSTGSGCSNYSVSNDGSLLFIAGKYEEPVNEPVFVNLEGEVEYLDFPRKRSYQSPRISPDGESLLITEIEENANLWVFGLERGTTRRFTEREYNSFWAIWSPDGKKIVFNSNRHGGTSVNLFIKNADGSGQAQQLANGEFHQPPKCWSADGKLLIYSEGVHPETGMDIYMLKMDSDSLPIPLMNDRYNETHPAISPDGEWLAFVSDQSGQEEVFVCRFPELTEVVQISANGGTEPVWAPRESVIYYRDITGDKVYKVPFTKNPDFDAGKPVKLFEKSLKESSGPWGRNYDIMPDGKKFLMIGETPVENDEKQIQIILNWDNELESLFSNSR